MKQKYLRNTGMGNVRIRGGKVLPITVARYACRCLECLATLTYYNNGLVCSEDASHNGIVTKAEAEQEATRRSEQLQQVKTNYAIRDGQLVALDDHIGESNDH